MRKNNKTKVTTASILAELLQNCCPVCKGPLAKHDYSLLASVIAHNEQETKELFEYVTRKQWHEAKKYREWDSLKDNIAVYVVRCPKDLLAILILDDPFELFLDINLISAKVLDASNSKSLQAAIAEWQLFS